MTRLGYTLMTEQCGPKQLAECAVGPEQAGFDFEVSSDHYFPWPSAQGHAPYAWRVLGAVANLNEHVVGQGWPSVDSCQERRVEAVEIALDAAVEAARPFGEAGFTDVALVQVGDETRQELLDQATGPLLEKLRAAAGDCR